MRMAVTASATERNRITPRSGHEHRRNSVVVGGQAAEDEGDIPSGCGEGGLGEQREPARAAEGHGGEVDHEVPGARDTASASVAATIGRVSMSSSPLTRTTRISPSDDAHDSTSQQHPAAASRDRDAATRVSWSGEWLPVSESMPNPKV
jgi:hypothetical protein